MNKKTKTIKVYEEDYKKLALRKLTGSYRTLAEVVHKVMKEWEGAPQEG